MKINHAILHILDFDSAVNVMSERELDFDTRAVRSFVNSHLRRARTSVDNRRAAFSEESAFAGELKGYFFGDREFVDLSQQIAEFFAAELAKADKMESTDVLVADFDDDDDVRWFAVLLMASRTAFMHEVAREGGEVRNDIAKRYAILPGPSQKVNSYALVRASSMEAFYVDKKRKIMGEDTFIIPDGLLQCESGVSGKEVIEAVTRIVEEVAEEHGANTAVALGRRPKLRWPRRSKLTRRSPPGISPRTSSRMSPCSRSASRSACARSACPNAWPGSAGAKSRQSPVPRPARFAPTPASR